MTSGSQLVSMVMLPLMKEETIEGIVAGMTGVMTMTGIGIVTTGDMTGPVVSKPPNPLTLALKLQRRRKGGLRGLIKIKSCLVLYKTAFFYFDFNDWSLRNLRLRKDFRGV